MLHGFDASEGTVQSKTIYARFVYIDNSPLMQSTVSRFRRLHHSGHSYTTRATCTTRTTNAHYRTTPGWDVPKTVPFFPSCPSCRAGP